jgi:hypothetical protein
MKSNSRKARFLLLLGILLMGAMPMKSGNLYVFGTNGSKQSFSLNDVRKLTFTATDLVVNKKDGTTTPIAFTTLRYFGLLDNLGTGIAVITEAAVSVYPNPVVADVTITSDKAITNLSLYNLQGQQLLKLAPASLEVNVPFSSYPSGIYILQITDESGSTIRKIIKN